MGTTSSMQSPSSGYSQPAYPTQSQPSSRSASSARRNFQEVQLVHANDSTNEYERGTSSIVAEESSSRHALRREKTLGLGYEQPTYKVSVMKTFTI